MSDVQRICPQCGQGAPLNAQFCPHCGYDHDAALPAPQNTLPATIGRAALPVLAGAATLALRGGWKLLNSWLAQNAAQPPQPRPESTVQREERPKGKARRTIHIRSSWTVGDSRGNWQQGSSEHHIDLDD